MAMTPERRNMIIIDYMDGEIPDDLICAKYDITPEQLDLIQRIGTGSIINPEPLYRGLKTGCRGSRAVSQMARETLEPEDMAVSPLQTVELMEPDHRNAALYLSEQELNFANNVLRGFKPVAAAAASYEIYNEPLATRKAAELLRASHVAHYLQVMRGRSLFAPLRNKAYLKAVLWQVIDRSMELKQVYDLLGREVEGQCAYNPKMAIAAAGLLARMEGWDSAARDEKGAESQRDRLRRIAAQYQQEMARDE